MLNKIISIIKPKSVDNFFAKLNFFKDNMIDKAKHYFFGLMNGFKRFSIEALQLATPDETYSYRELHYFLDKAEWDENELNEKRIQFLEQDVRTRTKSEGGISIDDTSTKKCGDKTDGTFWQYSPAEGQEGNCKVVVTSHYADNVKDFPLDAESYYQNEESKLDLACMVIDKAIKRDLSFIWVFFDSWYCTKQVVEKVEEHQKYFVSYMKSNRIVRYKNQSISVSDLVKIASADSSDRIIDLGKLYVKSLGLYRLIIKNSKCFITNNFEEKSEAIIDQYKTRWSIDNFYRQSKDNLAFDQFQVRSGLSIMRHWTMIFLAYTFWVHSKLKGVFSKIYQGTIDTLSEFTRLMQNLNLVRVAKDQTNVLLAKLSLNSLN